VSPPSELSSPVRAKNASSNPWAVISSVPDVASDAAPETGMATALNTGHLEYKLSGAGGTSAAAPVWAGLIALANQYAGCRLGFVNPAI
jgi:kumamolisin